MPRRYTSASELEQVAREVTKNPLQRQLGVKVVHLLKTTTSSQRRDVAPYMFVQGHADLGTYKAKLLNILMDSGALHGSYISNKWYEDNRDRINPTCVKAVEGTVAYSRDYDENVGQVNYWANEGRRTNSEQAWAMYDDYRQRLEVPYQCVMCDDETTASRTSHIRLSRGC